MVYSTYDGGLYTIYGIMHVLCIMDYIENLYVCWCVNKSSFVANIRKSLYYIISRYVEHRDF